jgi:hypothetical protein
VATAAFASTGSVEAQSVAEAIAEVLARVTGSIVVTSTVLGDGATLLPTDPPTLAGEWTKGDEPTLAGAWVKGDAPTLAGEWTKNEADSESLELAA